MIEILYICYDILIIIKLSLSYKVKKDKITWFMICDYVLIILIFLYALPLIFVIYIYFRDAGYLVRIKEKAIKLKKFREININDYILPDNFVKMKDYDKRKYLLNNKNRYGINISEEHKKLIAEINKLRKENKMDKLNYEGKINFDKLFFDNFSEPYFYENENIFKFPNESYLLKYPLNEFKERFNIKGENTNSILLNYYFNEIIIIEKNNNIFIFLFKSDKKISNHIYYEIISENTELY